MDDFLHNLRSGKLKQQDRGRRDYSDYKGPQRRAGNDRRRPDYYMKVTNENFAIIKESLSQLTESQKHVGEALSMLDKTGARIADSLQSLIDLISSLQRGKDRDAQSLSFAPAEETSAVEEVAERPTKSETKDAHAVTPSSKGKLSEEDKPRMMEIIASMRGEKKSWEKIAQHIDDLRFPTVSGKGRWRGQAIKKFFDANS
jgi:hypothetical protein